MSRLQFALKPLRQYADFSGRSTRTEFAAFYCTTMLATLAVVLATMTAGEQTGWIATSALGLLLLCPWAALFVRRVHDAGLSGWWVALCVPVVIQNIIADYYWLTGDFEAMLAVRYSTQHFLAAIPLLAVFFFLLLPGEEGANRYGPNPRYDPPGEAATQIAGLPPVDRVR